MAKRGPNDILTRVAWPITLLYQDIFNYMVNSAWFIPHISWTVLARAAQTPNDSCRWFLFVPFGGGQVAAVPGVPR